MLLYTMVLGLVITYCYAVIGWKLLIPEFKYGFNDAPDWGAETHFYDWVLVHWEQGFRDGPYSLQDWESGGMPFNFFVLSFSYFMLVVVIMGSVISGVIIDAFGEKRDEKGQMEEDIKDVDFVSGLERAEFESIQLDFDSIVYQQHHIENYLYYSIHLHEKNSDDFTGQESYVAGLIEEKDPGFFPTGRSSALEIGLKAKERASTGDDESSMETAIKSVNYRVTDMEHVLQATSKARHAPSSIPYPMSWPARAWLSHCAACPAPLRDARSRVDADPHPYRPSRS